MSKRTCTTALIIWAAGTTAALGSISPAAAGGVGDFLSPAFDTNCANQRTGADAAGRTTNGTGAANGNLLGLPLGTALNQCGGADTPSITDIQNTMNAVQSQTNGSTDLVTALKIQGATSSLQ
ncbi:MULTISPECIES: hypothetical protein [Streptomyces]|uniref:Secreted protein n=1 Tax=Streptomyces xanthochromogenes TaxID=67384 RepID=A0ABQ3ASB2_9ACTN|nr:MULTISPECIES: hypothetical protein [Streptomyces]MYV92460.1 hypothetical protein [Streptomyces sp. SID1034]GGY64251.1 hypothetical protein GCM10010326_68700 [Streptomyces xanthochromogenes]